MRRPTSSRPGAGGWLSGVWPAVLWHRRLLAAALAAGAVGVGLTVVAPNPPATVSVWAAAHDLAPGQRLAADDVAEIALPAGAVPTGVLRPGAAVLDGRVLAGPVRRGEPLTDVRFVGSPLVATLGKGLVATPVRIADAEAAALLRPGDIVDVIAAGQVAAIVDEPVAASSYVVASGVRVVSVPPGDPDDDFAPTGPADGALVVLATKPEAATDLAGASVGARLSVIVRPG